MEKMRTWMETEGHRYSQRTQIGQAISYAYYMLKQHDAYP